MGTARESMETSDVERERSANACHVAASVLRSLGESLGPANEDAPVFLLWATQLDRRERLLRAHRGIVDGRVSLRVVR